MAGQLPERPLLPRVSAEVERLEGECLLLREELARLHCERDDLLHTIGPNLEADYQLKIGTRQLELLTVQLEFRTLRRKIELWQTALNRGLRPSEHEIEWTLQRELERWQQGVADQAAAIDRAQRRVDSFLDPADGRELRQLYRRLALRLHPDVNPDHGPQAKALWLQVAAAYHAADLPELKALAILAEDIPALGPLDLPADQLALKHQGLKQAVQHLLDELAAIRAAPPHSLAPLLADERWVAERRQEMQNEIDSLTARIAHLRVVLETLLRSGYDERQPDAN
ncbi:MAG: J domain-containing protein [Armatimonadetes bacterium]|nr:J domain-containing protein [Armatimonadota bacterium]